MKTCTKCKIEKPFVEFQNRKQSKDGLHPECRVCVAETQKKYRLENKERIKENRRAWVSANKKNVYKYAKAYKQANPEKIARSQRKYAEANRAKTIAATRAWQIANPERVSMVRRAWCAANPDKVGEQARRRRARKMQVAGTHTAADVRDIYEKQRGLCANCGKKLFKSGKKKFHIDHIQPLAKGGSDDKYNLQCLCPGCNQRKHAKDPISWANENGKLL